MSLGTDIRDAFIEVGSSFTLLRESENVSGEYMIVTPNRQVTKPFIKEFFLECQFSYNTASLTGDILEFNTTGTKYIVMNTTPELFEDEIYRNSGVIYKTNVVGNLLRPSGESWDNISYHKEIQWENVVIDQPALQTEPLFGNSLDTDNELAAMSIERDELYLPHSIGAQPLDRWYISSGEYYTVETIIQRRFNNVDVIKLSEDNR